VLKAIETGSDAAPSDLLTDCLSIGEHFQTFIPFNLDLFALLPYTLLAIVLVRIGSRKTAV
jgi:hypothetical protein